MIDEIDSPVCSMTYETPKVGGKLEFVDFSSVGPASRSGSRGSES